MSDEKNPGDSSTVLKESADAPAVFDDDLEDAAGTDDASAGGILEEEASRVDFEVVEKNEAVVENEDGTALIDEAVETAESVEEDAVELEAADTAEVVFDEATSPDLPQAAATADDGTSADASPSELPFTPDGPRGGEADPDAFHFVQEDGPSDLGGWSPADSDEKEEETPKSEGERPTRPRERRPQKSHTTPTTLIVSALLGLAVVLAAFFTWKLMSGNGSDKPAATKKKDPKSERGTIPFRPGGKVDF